MVSHVLGSFKLEAAKRQVSETLTRLKELETELTASRERCDQQAQQLLKKSSMFIRLSAFLVDGSVPCSIIAVSEMLPFNALSL